MLAANRGRRGLSTDHRTTTGLSEFFVGHSAGYGAARSHGQRGGLCSRSPRASARGLHASGEERTPVRPGVCRIKAPCASWGTVTWHTNRRGQAERRRVSEETGQHDSPGRHDSAGWPLFPQSPGSRPGLVCVRGRAHSCSAWTVQHKSPQRACSRPWRRGATLWQLRLVCSDGGEPPRPLLD